MNLICALALPVYLYLPHAALYFPKHRIVICMESWVWFYIFSVDCAVPRPWFYSHNSWVVRFIPYIEHFGNGLDTPRESKSDRFMTLPDLLDSKVVRKVNDPFLSSWNHQFYDS